MDILCSSCGAFECGEWGGLCCFCETSAQLFDPQESYQPAIDFEQHADYDPTAIEVFYEEEPPQLEPASGPSAAPAAPVHSPTGTYFAKLRVQVEDLADRLSLDPSLTKQAAHFLMRYYSAEVGRTGKSPKSNERLSSAGISASAAALIYLACRQSRVPRTFREVSKAASIKPKFIWRRASNIWKAIEVKSIERNKPTDFLPRFCGRLDLPFAVEKRARELVSKADVTTSPVALAATAIFVASGRPGKQVAAVTGISLITLRKLAKVLEKIQV